MCHISGLQEFRNALRSHSRTFVCSHAFLSSYANTLLRVHCTLYSMYDGCSRFQYRSIFPLFPATNSRHLCAHPFASVQSLSPVCHRVIRRVYMGHATRVVVARRRRTDASIHSSFPHEKEDEYIYIYIFLLALPAPVFRGAAALASGGTPLVNSMHSVHGATADHDVSSTYLSAAVRE